MTDVTATGAGLPDSYDLTYGLDGSSYMVRENLVDIIERELLGPLGGPKEVLSFSPRTQYLVGHVAPVKLDEQALRNPASDNSATEGDGLAEVRIDPDPTARDAIGPNVPAVAADDGGADHSNDGSDDDVEDKAPRQGLMIPASMGLRFQVPIDQAFIRVTASWGVYESFVDGQDEKTDKIIRKYRRVPITERCTIDLTGLPAGKTTTVALRDQSVLRIDRYDDDLRGRILVEIALCNDRETPLPIPLSMWMFQTKLVVDARGAEVFLPVQDVMEHDWPEHDDEVKRLNLQYRDRLEYAIGRTCSATWTVRTGARRATSVQTTWLPVGETPQTKPGTIDGAVMSMADLAEIDVKGLRDGLAPLIDGYAAWIDSQEAIMASLPCHLREVANLAMWEARVAHQRLVAGLEHITTDTEALRCFRFMNAVMRDQRLASQVAALRAADSTLSIAEARITVEARGPGAASWRPFQLAFILMQLPALTDPTAQGRSDRHLAKVELLFFPTGGGKTEAYLGLAAYTFAIRRRQGILTTPDGPLDGNDGVAVLMRYTLRLLTAQQFQRATALVCAAELIRLQDPATWGTIPFRIGLWVGTAVSPKRFDEAKKELERVRKHAGFRLTVLQIQRCPWCGTPISGSKNVDPDEDLRRIYVRCGDDLARCPFSKGGVVAEGLPILTVDEEIYRLTPAFVIATVDKFARLAREGEAAALFGYVGRKCPRHGYVHPDYEVCGVSGHNKKGRLPAATIVPTGRLRPPDLIIQDELHLITGALGTAVGLFEVAIETLCSWDMMDGRPVKPLIVASTATVRNAQNQVKALYGRDVEIFPPQVLSVTDTYFSKEVPIDRANPGRRYIGVSAQGVRLSAAEIRVAEVLLLAGQLLFDQAGEAADPYMTLVGYFNATRELAGMARFIDDDVLTRVKKPRNGLPKRRGAVFGFLNKGELTSRIASSQIGSTLDRLALGFDPTYDTTEAAGQRNKANREAKAAGKPQSKGRAESVSPYDVVLATSMLQVGVDVQRLGLMLVVGQPKNTAEYIQASSRVGRDSTARPGLVVCLGNWARPRDLAHFEQFRHYHETFYAQVEALSVTPYSPTSLERGVSGLLVSVARVTQAPLLDNGLSPEKQAQAIIAQHDSVIALSARLRDRINLAAQDDIAAKRAADLLVGCIDRWTNRAALAVKQSKSLVYEKTGEKDMFLSLIESPENASTDIGSAQTAPFKIANSMREVQPEINLLVSPIKDKLFVLQPEDAPAWTLPLLEEDE